MGIEKRLERLEHHYATRLQLNREIEALMQQLPPDVVEQILREVARQMDGE